jgi:1-deoxy-D-xylulose-5-phosphate synthase
MSYIDSFEKISDLKKLSTEELPNFCADLREFIIKTVSKTGGHLGASLGVIELTVALHYVFSSPEDKIIWDVGHQAYPHKVLTGRKNMLHTIRTEGGLSGFTNIFESEHDVFGAGHSSTSISAGLGISAVSKEKFVLPVIGDGAMSAGLAFEGLNNAAETAGKMIVILNDNDMSISPPTGAISKYLSRIANSSTFLEVKSISKKILPEIAIDYIKGFEKILKNTISGENIFESLNFDYYGPIDGHNIIKLVEWLNYFKENIKQGKPILLHIKTEKGKGYKPAEMSADKFHGVSPFCLETGMQNKKSGSESFSLVASRTLCEIAETDEKIFAITPAMKAGSCLENFASKFPKRFFDVGIAEQHAVTFSGGIATEKMKPYCFIYSTFLQRGYDQLIHDVCLQNLPVRFMIDRAGIVGEDGATHNGVFDIAFLRIIPNIVIISPSSKEELQKAINFSANFEKSPLVIRFPRGEANNDTNPTSSFEFGKGRILQQGTEIGILGIGTTVTYALEMATKEDSVIDLRFLKPLDEALILETFRNHKKVILLEDGSIGGVYSAILELLHKNQFSTQNFESFILPDKFIEHGKVSDIHKKLLIKK